MRNMDAKKGLAGVIAVIVLFFVTVAGCYGFYVLTGGGVVQ